MTLHTRLIYLTGLLAGLILFTASCGRQEAPEKIWPTSSLSRSEAMRAANSIQLAGERWVKPLSETSYSMIPLMNRAVLVIEPLAFGDTIRVGDLVVFSTDTSPRPICHQVIGLRGDQVYTKGTGNLRADPPINRSSIEGRVVAIVYHDGTP